MMNTVCEVSFTSVIVSPAPDGVLACLKQRAKTRHVRGLLSQGQYHDVGTVTAAALAFPRLTGPSHPEPNRGGDSSQFMIHDGP